jgi:hypothetical protein
MRFRYRLFAPVAALLLGAFVPAARPAHAADCFDIRVDYQGRDFLGFTGGVAYYRWHYRVVGETCNAKRLSHWVLELCQNYWPNVSEVSTLSVDSSQPADGDSTWYTYALGTDPTTGVSGLKWNTDHGNALDTAAEYDDFSFISPGSEDLIVVGWGSKAGQIVEYGTTIGPSCTPLPALRETWGRVKSRYRY